LDLAEPLLGAYVASGFSVKRGGEPPGEGWINRPLIRHCVGAAIGRLRCGGSPANHSPCGARCGGPRSFCAQPHARAERRPVPKSDGTRR
jgi:hypothetical protein